jgi:hypothetical protein
MIMGTGGPIDIMDNQTGSSAITIAEDRMVDSLFISMDIQHSWVGDLTMSLTSPGNITADIMVRPGGGTPFGDPGDGSDLGFWFYPPNTTTPTAPLGHGRYSFGDAGQPDFWGAAGAVGPNDTIPEGFYQASDIAGVAVSLDTIFASADTQGDWTLTISDGATPDVGELIVWELNIVPLAGPGIPEPATLVLFGLGLAGLRFSKRRKV